MVKNGKNVKWILIREKSVCVLTDIKRKTYSWYLNEIFKQLSFIIKRYTFLNKLNKSHYTVSELIANTRKVLELSFQSIWVDGEISNLHYHSSGHIYFVLKDSDAEVKCAMFKRSAMSLRFQLEEGMRIVVFGSISIFEARGQILRHNN